ncbi:MAG: hypothetical protein ACI8RA_001512 [Chlamydiales bacterium]
MECAKNLEVLDLTGCRYPMYWIGYLTTESDLARLKECLPQLIIRDET